MKLNNTSQYAIRIMVFIAQNSTVKLFHAKEISEKLSIPYKYLTRIMTQLVKAKIITSIRGREGGYTIAREPSDIKMIDVLNAVNECLNDVNCVLGVGLCDEKKKCSLHDKWRAPKKSIVSMFKNTTLSNITQQPHC